MPNWHARMAVMGERLRTTFGISARLTYAEDGLAVDLKAVFKRKLDEQEALDELETIDTEPRADIYRQDLPLDDEGQVREPAEQMDTLEIFEAALVGTRTLEPGVYTIVRVGKDSGSMYSLQLRESF